MNKINKGFLAAFFIVAACFVWSFDVEVFADEQTPQGNPGAVYVEETTTCLDLVYITEYQLDNQSIIAGKEFTLKIKVENYSNQAAARNVVVMIDNPPGVVPEYGTVSVEYVDYIGPREAIELVFRYKADSDIEAAELDFNARVSSDLNNTSTVIRLPVGREGDFSVEEFTFPKSFVIEKKENVSAVVENISNKEIDNVAIILNCDGEEVKSQNIGKMMPGASKTEYIDVVLEKEYKGQHFFELLLRYTDGGGNNKEFIITSGTYTVDDKEIETETSLDKSDTNEKAESADIQNGANSIVIICTIGIIMIAACCVVLLLLYRRK